LWLAASTRKKQEDLKNGKRPVLGQATSACKISMDKAGFIGKLNRLGLFAPDAHATVAAHVLTG